MMVVMKRFGALLVGAGLLAGCADLFAEDPDQSVPDGALVVGQPNPGEVEVYESNRLFEDTEDDGSGGRVNVNTFLWRGALDTLSFLPLVSADPFGGVIITDWYAPPESPNERFKVTAYILDRVLRADAIRVSVFRQIQRAPGQWVDAPLAEKVPGELENGILTRARQLRIRTLATP